MKSIDEQEVDDMLNSAGVAAVFGARKKAVAIIMGWIAQAEKEAMVDRAEHYSLGNNMYTSFQAKCACGRTFKYSETRDAHVRWQELCLAHLKGDKE